MNEHWRVGTGYLNQAALQRSAALLESNHTLMVSVISSAPFRK